MPIWSKIRRMSDIRLRGLVAVFIFAFWTASAVAQTVQTVDQLRTALVQATPGTIIALEAGDYGRLQWQGGRGVTLRGPASFSGLDLQGVRDIRFEGVRFAYRYGAGDAPHLRPFVVQGSDGVTFENVSFTGDSGTDGFPSGYGLTITDSRNVILNQSRLTGFLRGLVATRSSALRITGNDIAGMRSDGLNFAQVTDVAITGNHIHDFNRDTTNSDHADMIQFWTDGTTAPSRDITIAGNVLNAGAGAWTQSVFMRNEVVDQGRAGADMFYENVSITGNLIINAHTHGITLGEARGVTIAHNTLVQTPAAAGGADNPNLWTPRIRVVGAARDVTLRGNITAGLPDAQPGWEVTGNLLVQNRTPNAAGYYATVFGPQAISDPANPASYRSLQAGVGATP